MDLKQMLDLSNWEEYAWVTSAQGPMCPKCQRVHDRPATGVCIVVALCQACNSLFLARSVVSPFGTAWQTPTNEKAANSEVLLLSKLATAMQPAHGAAASGPYQADAQGIRR